LVILTVGPLIRKFVYTACKCPQATISAPIED
jgi:hypothetical protein